MKTTPVDLWDLTTFDEALRKELECERDLLRDYALTERMQFLERQEADRWSPHHSNPYSWAPNWFVEHVVAPAMTERTIRAWHYTRLTDAEADFLKREGIYVSNLEAIRRRLDVQVSLGTISAEAADALYAESPFHHQNDARSSRFWMTSHPIPTNDSGVEPLLTHWGGEGVYFWQNDPKLIQLVQGLGKPRVIEVAVPLRVTSHAFSAAKAVVSTFVRTLDCEADIGAFDLHTRTALDPDAVLAIHTEGEPMFATLGRGYPVRFVVRAS